MAGDEQQGPGVLHLGEVGGNEPPPSPGGSSASQTRPRWAITIAVFLVGVMVGSYGWLARSDLLGFNQVDLIVTEIHHDLPRSDGTLGRLIVDVRNVGGNEVTITQARLPDQSADGDRGGREVAIPAGEKTAIAISGELNCATELPDVIEADVRTPAGETSADLPVPTTNVLYAWQCRSDEPAEVWVEIIPSAAAPGDGFGLSGSRLRMPIPLNIRSWSVDEVRIVDVAVSSSPGLDAEPSGLVGRHETGTVADLAAEWTVIDCSSVFPIEPIDIAVSFADHPTATVRVPESVLPTLVSLTSVACGS